MLRIYGISLKNPEEIAKDIRLSARFLLKKEEISNESIYSEFTNTQKRVIFLGDVRKYLFEIYKQTEVFYPFKGYKC